MKPLVHAKLSVKRHGGTIDDYIPIHEFIDSSKITMPDIRHRAILHSSFGCYLAQQVFGNYIVNSDGKEVSVRDIAEEHISEDMHGWIPTPQDWLENLEIKDWMRNRPKENRRVIKHERTD